MNKKILFIINNLGIGGAERLVVDDVNEMMKQGIDISIITLRPEPKESLFSQLKIPADRFRCVYFKNLLDIPGWIRVIKAIKEVNPDLVITQLWFENTVGRIASIIVGAKIITFEQNVYDSVKTRKMFVVDYLLQSLSARVIAVSEAVKRSLIKHGIKEKRINIVPNSVNLDAFKILPDKNGIRQELGIPQGSFIFVFVGRLIHQKAVDILIKAFKELDENSYLLVVGQGQEKGRLEKLANDRVIFAGIRKDIPQILMSSDCFVLPSRYEGWPLALTEALAAGIPIIVSDFEAAREVIKDKENGLVVPREDHVSLALTMREMRENKELRKRLGEEAKRSAERFSIENHVRAILRYT
ncbi:MAG: hypothetical protein A3B99_00880 [Candidatus Yanofskybacteria bacterium RIFCSPHIGHO2_02_FULL_44_12b]|uniref:Glycosyltransferase subfamily 4-like N-terminal domain-containing protein n=2 Tax=Candidatus Zambryskiibacteriota TaxID=1817925 RepID=A0A1G2T1X8_9BACT|nr:MAG: hypothetical protein A3B99_00880 [Candidatus Yanofskybacteria bacterium RIFCSPHIGHO2_02_FULL_44_12b]OHA91132.1 MAG: hypothetical protein A2758_01490 [Candidatus Zambryskibacteria bacterium RIFCSPHIGHO2_01_FULL_49_18]OHB05170.1 MAG: hypothetical protein A3A26_02620 [Candidatus Zambryskibacteria bacterium RIFCSPLOWO2_01_FULL_47_14]